MGFGIGNGIVKLVQRWGKGIGNAADNIWLRADAQKAIKKEVLDKYKPKIDLANRAESRRANNIKDLGDKLAQSKKELQDAKDAWQKNYDTALADAKSRRQADIDDYTTKLQGYNEALANAKASRQSIFDQLSDSEAYTPSKTIFTDVNTGEKYILNPITGSYENLAKTYKQLGSAKAQQKFFNRIQDYDERLFDQQSGKVINAFDVNSQQYKGKSSFDTYYNNKISTQGKSAALRDAENQISKANSELTNWKNKGQPKAWGKRDSNQFDKDFRSNNESPTDYTFNGQKYSSDPELEKAYKEALNNEQSRQNLYSKVASDYASKRDAEIAQRIQDAKDMNKAKVALGGTLGAGALYAAARAMYGGDDTDNTDNTNTNINNTNNTDNGEPDPDFNVENIPGAKDLINDRQPDTGFDPDKANALASASYAKGVEDGNSIASSDDLGNRIEASTGGHTIDDELLELLKDMQDPYKADAVANYIYSKHGNNSEVQRLGWRGWLNKYYGDALRSIMNIDPSGYKGMHISGGL